MFSCCLTSTTLLLWELKLAVLRNFITEKGAATADVSKIQGKSALKPCKARSQPLLATISEISPGSGGTTECFVRTSSDQEITKYVETAPGNGRESSQ